MCIPNLLVYFFLFAHFGCSVFKYKAALLLLLQQGHISFCVTDLNDPCFFCWLCHFLQQLIGHSTFTHMPLSLLLSTSVLLTSGQVSHMNLKVISFFWYRSSFYFCVFFSCFLFFSLLLMLSYLMNCSVATHESFYLWRSTAWVKCFKLGSFNRTILMIRIVMTPCFQKYPLICDIFLGQTEFTFLCLTLICGFALALFFFFWFPIGFHCPACHLLTLARLLYASSPRSCTSSGPTRLPPPTAEEHGRCSPTGRPTPTWPPTWRRTGTEAQCRYRFTSSIPQFSNPTLPF